MSGPVSAELSQKISEWRRKTLDGTITQDEMVEAIRHLRADRLSAAVASQAARGKKVIAAPAAEDLLSEMDNI